MPELSDLQRSAIAARCRALGDETRLRVFEHLTDGAQAVSELVAATGLGQSLVSHHLRVLRQAGLVSVRREGRWAVYSMNPPALASVRRVLELLEPEITP